jgi:hypothetical protein
LLKKDGDRLRHCYALHVRDAILSISHPFMGHGRHSGGKIVARNRAGERVFSEL